MGQPQLQAMQSKVNTLISTNNPQQPISTEILLQELLPPNNQLTASLSVQDLQRHISKYLQTVREEAEVKPKRRRSYELIKEQEKVIEDSKEEPKRELGIRHRKIEERMEILEIVESKIRANITELMATKKVYKIRQTFRRLMLNLLEIDNLYLYVHHSRGTLEFHDFRQNFITEIIELDRIKMAEKIINLGYHSEDTLEVMQFFELGIQYDSQKQLFGWGTTQESRGVSVLYVWKSRKEGIKNVGNRMVQLISKIALISTMEEQTAIMNYCKGLLEILEHFIGEWQKQTIQELDHQESSIQEVEQQLIQAGSQDQQLLVRVRSYQQLQFELLEKARMYKKYVCQGDKAFLQFDQRAQLSFLSNNFNHQLLTSIPQLWDKKQLYLEKIFPEHKPISDFLKRAGKQKVKDNKLYELDFESKIRVKYNSEGAISRLHLIIEELDNSSSSNSNYYTSSSTHILSEGSSSQPGAQKQDESEVEYTRTRKPSALVRNLEKNNPGITNQGWINLFIKDQALHPRKNTYFKTKTGKAYDVKRSFSLCAELLTENSDQKKKIQGLNTDSTDLDLLQLQDDLLEPLVIKVFKRLELFQGDHVDKLAFENFLGEIHKGYQIHNNPFHNFTHGVNVMHTCFLLSSSPRVRILFSPLKLFAIVFSGLCHDVGHTGFTNLFEIASQSRKAITYNDSSPLENFHAALTFEILRKPQNSFLKLSAEEQKQFRQQVVKNILFTDIKEHFPLLQKFNKLIKEQMQKSDEYIQVLSSMIVHTADFGGSAKQFELCKAWSLRVNLEFSNQYKKEGELGLPQTPFMKDLTNISILSKNQGGFLKVIVCPLYQAMDDFCGNDARVRKLRQHIEDNIQRWESIYQTSLEKKDQKPQQKKQEKQEDEKKEEDK